MPAIQNQNQVNFGAELLSSAEKEAQLFLDFCRNHSKNLTLQELRELAHMSYNRYASLVADAYKALGNSEEDKILIEESVKVREKTWNAIFPWLHTENIDTLYTVWHDMKLQN